MLIPLLGLGLAGWGLWHFVLAPKGPQVPGYGGPPPFVPSVPPPPLTGPLVGPPVPGTPGGPPPLPSGTPPSAAPAVAPPVVTLPTATEAATTLRVVSPKHQPRVPASDKAETARALAPAIRDALVANTAGAGYHKSDPHLTEQVRRFQGALGLGQDGLYGPQTAGALMYYLGAPPPPPFFYEGERTIKAYLPVP